ncbi:dihydroneopterin triphosphate diphosphatase [Dechloromonas denitrificans]|uniref:dihydroneopterin triphosphate diphosphatase n=1 Tax=Dechloromonas denitrificans TaxID=281362 RepID=UPI001CFAD8C6|nr:dihydroneopterin triphosphate diphosphatase [Dechloromonas denitrificans]UCV07277.1 dihydroneopterin triphosphate diphosphatase [Dechloromonas denitrificans]
MSGFKQPVSVLVVIYTAALDVLLLERSAHPGFWQSVTGSREGDEVLIDTARREVGEETGINAADHPVDDWQITNTFEIFAEWRHRYGPGVTENTEHVFGLQLPHRIAITPAPDEHRDWTWMPWQAAAERCFSWSNRDAILLLPEHVKRKI